MPKRCKVEEPPASKSPPPSQDLPPPRKRSKQIEIKKEDSAVVNVDSNPGSTPAEGAVAESNSQTASKQTPGESCQGAEAGSGGDSDTPPDLEAACSDLRSFVDNVPDIPSRNGSKRDTDYYFQDGNVVVLVGGVLFKIHASLFTSRSNVFKDVFSVDIDVDATPTEGKELLEPAGDDVSTKRVDDACHEDETTGDGEGSDNNEVTEPDTGIEGTCGGIPIEIGDVEPSEFRNLLKIFYCLPYDTPLAVLGDESVGGECLWAKFEFLLDVARLSRRFCIPDMEKWASLKLKTLTNTKTESLGDFLHGLDIRASYLLGAIQYAKQASDPGLIYDIRYMLLYSCHSSEGSSHIVTTLSFFRANDLRKTDVSLYGYLFLLMLHEGHEAWGTEGFTQHDRMALFSTQAYLTPLPDKLFEAIVSPLFRKPSSALAFSNEVFSKSAAQTCIDKCHKAASRAWKQAFDTPHYDDLTGLKFLASIGALISLPWRRLKFARDIQAQPCSRRCHDAILLQVDQDIERVYTRLADYYKAIN